MGVVTILSVLREREPAIEKRGLNGAGVVAKKRVTHRAVQ
jgi:hypothetical protein